MKKSAAEELDEKIAKFKQDVYLHKFQHYQFEMELDPDDDPEELMKGQDDLHI